jgi:signal transduction histidine kinase
VLALRVADGAGRPLWRTRLAVDARYAAVDTLEPRFGAMRLHLALNPVMADRLVIGGLPRSRLPLLVALLAVTSGLVVVAVLQLRRQQELARMRTDFVSGVSHELRTPLAQIRLLAELLHLGKPEHEAGRRRAARIIDQEARRLTYLVENVLAFSRSEHGTTRVAAAATDVGAVAGEVLEMFAPIAAAAGARVTLRADGGACAQADEAAVRQILLNFLDNAARYGPAGQTIVVDVRATGVGRGARRGAALGGGRGPRRAGGRAWTRVGAVLPPRARRRGDGRGQRDRPGGGARPRAPPGRADVDRGRAARGRALRRRAAGGDAATADAATAPYGVPLDVPLDDATRAPAAARGAPWARGEGR